MLPPSFQHRQREFLLSRLWRGPLAGDGGATAGAGDGATAAAFIGPAGAAADLYYTRFGLQLLDILVAPGWSVDGSCQAGAVGGASAPDGPEPQVTAEMFGRYLLSLPQPANVVDWLSLLHSLDLLGGWPSWPHDMRRQAAALSGEAVAFIGRCRQAGGCFADVPGGPAGPYFTMLALLALELAAGALPDELKLHDMPLLQSLACCLSAHRTADGGFTESAAMVGGAQANPTAAALVALSRLGAVDESVLEAAATVLVSLQNESGGVRAHGGAPLADLMSTFTVLEALRLTGRLRRLRLAGIGRFVRSLALPEGGFRATATETGADVEYTFYGLAAMSLLALAAKGSAADGHG